ncbi:hypothetical protein [Vibrio hippocampi]|uniref:MSHA biogenesis protein MshF n=1 Tax=Vibrio hippocampi TaxID=654686 RepID=A0ABM8ZJ80_9VIBR|nr:hypothetical protein [Vibrio hippocampi]CAH0526872.1 hypothetical protein VHP8226_02248 [Vibrio hippocampi]
MQIKSVLFQNNTLRWLIWLGVVLALIATFLGCFNRNQEKIMRTKAVVIAKTMQQRINQLHHLWLLNNQPKVLEVDGQSVEFDHRGWIVLSNSGPKNCNDLLSLLYKDINNGKYKLVTKYQNISLNSYVCIYEMDQIADIKINKINNLNINVVM